MHIFNSDFDNTLIFSYKHDIGEKKVNVEIYEGREISFMSKKSFELLKLVSDKLLFVPTTTRTAEQYNRIDLGIEKPKYALVCNGGVLLVDGKEDTQWYEASLKLARQAESELKKAVSLLEFDKRRSFELRFIKELFIFTKCEEEKELVSELRSKLDTSLVDVFNNGSKLYVLPKKLNKGQAVTRFKEKLGADKVIAAGDSEFDAAMLCAADIFLAPSDAKEIFGKAENLCYMPKEELFSEALLEYILQRNL